MPLAGLGKRTCKHFSNVLLKKKTFFDCSAATRGYSASVINTTEGCSQHGGWSRQKAMFFR
jgi:hypothetical protein